MLTANGYIQRDETGAVIWSAASSCRSHLSRSDGFDVVVRSLLMTDCCPTDHCPHAARRRVYDYRTPTAKHIQVSY